MNGPEEMQEKNKYCVMFSSVYPYETTLKNEFKVLSEHFEKIFYIPSSVAEPFNLEDFPKNVIALDIFNNLDTNIGKLFRKHIIKSLGIFLNEAFFSLKPWKYILRAKTYLSIAAVNIEKYSILKRLIQQGDLPAQAVFYDYWFVDSALAIAMLRKKRLIRKAVCRTHRFDLYDEAGNNFPVSFRRYIVRNLDNVCAISLHGQNYLKGKIPARYHGKILLHYLGIELPEDRMSAQSCDVSKVIISASNTQTFKRVHLIPDLLLQVKHPIKWIHFGCGPEDKNILEKIKHLPDHISVDWRGRVPNEVIHDFYQTRRTDLFISLSNSEGLPISMMEAISYGIPVFACSTCGIPELVNDQTGALFEKEDDLNTIAQKFEACIIKSFDREAIYQFAQKQFDFRKNYDKFINHVLK